MVTKAKNSTLEATLSVVNVGTGMDVLANEAPLQQSVHAKSIKAGTNVTITDDGSTLTINSTASGGTGGITGATNAGTGTGVASGVSGTSLVLKSLKAGPNISITSTADEITVEATGSASGEANTASNVGTGVGVFKSKTGVDLKFKSIKEGNNISIASSDDELTISSTISSGSLNVLELGAKGDGTTNDTASIQAAINLVSVSGGAVFFPSGTYMIASSLIVPSKVNLVGEGIDATIIKAMPGMSSSIITTLDTSTLISGNTAGGAKYWGVKNMTLDGNKSFATSSSVRGIYTYSRSYSIERVKIINCAGSGIYSRWGATNAAWENDAADLFMEANIQDVYIGYCNQEGLYFDGPHDSRISNVLVGLNSHSSAGSYAGIRVGSRAGGSQFTSCHSWGDTQKYAWWIEGGFTSYSNCVADDAYTALVQIDGNQVTWTGGLAFGAVFGTPTAQDLALKGFVLGSAGKPVYEPWIETAVRDCPKGVVHFVNAPTGQGVIKISGTLQVDLQGSGTYGYQGTVPSGYRAYINVAGPSNSVSADTYTSPSICSLTRTGAMTFANNAGTTISWDTEISDVHGMHTPGASTVTAPVTGMYRINASYQISATSDANGVIITSMYLLKNGAAVKASPFARHRGPNSSAYACGGQFNGTIELTAGDTVEMQGYYGGASATASLDNSFTFTCFDVELVTAY